MIGCHIYKIHNLGFFFHVLSTFRGILAFFDGLFSATSSNFWGVVEGLLPTTGWSICTFGSGCIVSCLGKTDLTAIVPAIDQSNKTTEEPEQLYEIEQLFDHASQSAATKKNPRLHRVILPLPLVGSASAQLAAQRTYNQPMPKGQKCSRHILYIHSNTPGYFYSADQ